MKRYIALALWVLFVSSCISSNNQIDKKEASELVYLDSNALTCFSKLRQQLIKDIIAIQKQNESVTAVPNRTDWITTNTYYLYQIDSSKYAGIISKVKNKLIDDFRIDKKGNVIFTIKQNIQMHDGDYNETYNHQLISTDCTEPINTLFNHVDSVFVDSIINTNWRYTYYKALTGH